MVKARVAHDHWQRTIMALTMPVSESMRFVPSSSAISSIRDAALARRAHGACT
jgi:mannose/fructose/N-acetylgalactosamine-specific phosphotransferase system component IIB